MCSVLLKLASMSTLFPFSGAINVLCSSNLKKSNYNQTNSTSDLFSVAISNSHRNLCLDPKRFISSINITSNKANQSFGNTLSENHWFKLPQTHGTIQDIVEFVQRRPIPLNEQPDNDCYRGVYNTSSIPLLHITHSELMCLNASIAAKKWEETLDLFPPRPSTRVCVNGKTAKQWVQAHVGEEEQALAKKLLDHTYSVSQAEFEGLGQLVTKDFNHYLDTLPEQEREYILSVSSPIKSERWVASLNLPYLKYLPKDVVLHENVGRALRKYPSVKRVIIYDDMVYSGCQMGRTIEDMLDAFADSRGPDSCSGMVHLLVPIISSQERLRSRWEWSSIPWTAVKIHTALFTKDVLEAQHVFKDQMPIVANMWREKMFSRSAINGNNNLITFDHKIADGWSIPKKLYTSTFADIYEYGKDKIAPSQEQLKMVKPLLEDFVPVYKHQLTEDVA
jgi:hypothetical protein